MKLSIAVLISWVFISSRVANAELTRCEAEHQRFCPELTSDSEVQTCLFKNHAALSIECKQEIEREVEARGQASARGGGSLAAFGGLNSMGPPVPLASYEGRYSPGSNHATTLSEDKVSVAAPFFHGHGDVYSSTVSGSALHLGENLTLDSGKAVPRDLYRLEAGLQYFDQLGERKMWGLRASVGAASDQPFTNARDTTYSLSATYGFPDSSKGYWMLLAFFSNNSSIGNYIPIPGFLYIYKTATFSGAFGFPIVSMQWTPVFPWVYSVSIFGPNIQAETAYGSLDHEQVFASYSWMRQYFIPAVRAEDRDRLAVEEMKLGVGLRRTFWGKLLGEIQAGEAFDRSVYIGTSLLKANGGSVTIPDDLFVALNFKAKF